MATIESYETKAGTRYLVRYRTPDHRQTKKRGFTTKRDAKAYAATVEVAKLRGAFVPHKAGRTTVSEVEVGWEEVMRARLSPTSWRNYETAWRLHVEPRWGRVAVSDVSKTDVERWLATMSRHGGGAPLSAPTRERAYTVLLGILDSAVGAGLVVTNGARGAALPERSPKRRVYLTAEHVARLAEEAGDHADLVLVLAFTGLRWSEAVGLRRDGVDLDAGRLSIHTAAKQNGSEGFVVGLPKGRKIRAVPVPAFLVERLRARLEGAERDVLVFPGDDGGFLLQPDSRHGWFQRAVKAADLPRITPHDLRHTCASLAVSAGANVKALQRMLGHSSAAMTLDTYADLFDSDLDVVASTLDRKYSSAVADCAQNVPTKDAA